MISNFLYTIVTGWIKRRNTKHLTDKNMLHLECLSLVFFIDELADITFEESFQIFMTDLIESVYVIFKPTEEQLAVCRPTPGIHL